MAKAKRIAQLSDLTPDTQNANKGTERGRYMVEASLTETGAGRSIVADKDGRIIAGNKTLEAWAGMGGAVKIVETDGQELVVVQRTDLDLSDPKGKARKLAYYDNRAGQVGLEWDAEQLLADVNAGVDLAAMFKADEIAELLAGVKGGDADAEPQIDQAEELNKKWQVKTGDLWRIGAHRLLCGDSTRAADVARVMGGERAAAVVTDPPWNVGWKYDTYKDDLTPEQYKDFSDGWRTNAESAGAKFFAVALSMKTYKHFALWFPMAERVFAECQNFTQHTAGFMQYAFNPILVWGNPGTESEAGKRDYYVAVTSNTKETADKRIAKINTATRWLPTVQYLIEFTAKVSTLYEPFAGSGTTLVACENLGRKCRAVEISPAYCAVILERMKQAFPKLEITRDDGAG